MEEYIPCSSALKYEEKSENETEGGGGPKGRMSLVPTCIYNHTRREWCREEERERANFVI